MPLSASIDVGHKIDQSEKLLNLVRQSPYSNALSQHNLIAGGLVIGSRDNAQDLKSMSIDKRLQQIAQQQ